MNYPKRPLLGAIFVIALIFIVISQLGGGSPTAPIRDDSCKLSESQVRQLWASASLHTRDEAERTRIAEQLVQATENICRSGRDAKPTPLPPELQKHVR